MNALHAPDEKAPYLLAGDRLCAGVPPAVCVWRGIQWESLFRLVLDDSTFRRKIPLIPFVSLFLVYENRKAIFAELSVGWILGSCLIASGMILLIVARLNLWHLSLTNPLSLLVFATFLIWLRSLYFLPLRISNGSLSLFLLFMVPIPVYSLKDTLT